MYRLYIDDFPIKPPLSSRIFQLRLMTPEGIPPVNPRA